MVRLSPRRRWLALAVSSIFLNVAAQTAQPPAAFEVASVKKEISADVPGGIRPIGPGGQFRAVLTVHELVQRGTERGAPKSTPHPPKWTPQRHYGLRERRNGLRTVLTGSAPP